MSTKIQMRRGTAAAWTAADPILAAGEHGFETDTGKEKIGNGESHWTSLPYGSGGGGALTPEEISSSQALAWGYAYVANAESGSLVLKLPAATGNGGSSLYVEVGPKSGVHTVTLERAGSEKIVTGSEELTTMVLSLEANAFSGVMLIAIANNPRVF